MEWAIRKKGLSEVMVRAVISLYDGAKTRVRVGSAYPENFEVKVGVHQGYVRCCYDYHSYSSGWMCGTNSKSGSCRQSN